VVKITRLHSRPLSFGLAFKDSLALFDSSPTFPAVPMPHHISLYSNVRPPGQASSKWQMSLQCTLLYPRKGKSTSD
jgi:hypothetical protein